MAQTKPQATVLYSTKEPKLRQCLEGTLAGGRLIRTAKVVTMATKAGGILIKDSSGAWYLVKNSNSLIKMDVVHRNF